MIIIICYLYLIGSILYIPASILLFWTDTDTAKWSTGIFIVASVLFLAGAIVDLWQWSRTMGILSRLISCLYLVGGTTFVTGSVLFWPTFGTITAGFWVFRVGSTSYFLGSLLIIINLETPRKPRKVAATAQYMTGSCLFVTGGIVSQTGQSYIIYATIWVIGSLAFTGGAALGLATEKKGLI